MNLDGGILRALRNQGNFLDGFSTQTVGNGGAGFNTNTYDVGVATAFSGTSSCNKLGAGILTLSGDSSAFTGNTEIQAGTLQVDGTLGGPVQVLAGARLTGRGPGRHDDHQSGHGRAGPAQRFWRADDRGRLRGPRRRAGDPHTARR